MGRSADEVADVIETDIEELETLIEILNGARLRITLVARIQRFPVKLGVPQLSMPNFLHHSKPHSCSCFNGFEIEKMGTSHLGATWATGHLGHGRIGRRAIWALERFGRRRIFGDGTFGRRVVSIEFLSGFVFA